MEDNGITIYSMEEYKKLENRDDRKAYLINFINQNKKYLKETRIDNFRYKLATFVFPTVATALAIKFGINDPSLFETCSIVVAGIPAIPSAYFLRQSNDSRKTAKRELDELLDDYNTIRNEEKEEEYQYAFDQACLEEANKRNPDAVKYYSNCISKLDGLEMKKAIEMEEKKVMFDENLAAIAREKEILSDLRFNINDYLYYYSIDSLDKVLIEKGYNADDIKFAKDSFEYIISKNKSLELKEEN